MKINPGFRPFGTDVRMGESVTKPVQHKSFADMMNNRHDQASNDELQQRLQDIYQQGERLSKSMTIRELRMYRMMVKRFFGGYSTAEPENSGNAWMGSTRQKQAISDCR